MKKWKHPSVTMILSDDLRSLIKSVAYSGICERYFLR